MISKVLVRGILVFGFEGIPNLFVVVTEWHCASNESWTRFTYLYLILIIARVIYYLCVKRTKSEFPCRSFTHLISV